MSRKNKRDDDLDTETTFCDMNVEGFRWYDPSKKREKGEKTVRHKISRKEYWQMVRSAFAAFLPFFIFFLLGMGVVVLLIYIWLT